MAEVLFELLETQMDPSIFKAYDIRGLYPEQLDEEATLIEIYWLFFANLTLGKAHHIFSYQLIKL